MNPPEQRGTVLDARASRRRPGRLMLLTLCAVAVAVPAAAARIACLGATCDSIASATATTPFCGLPPDVRERISQGYRAGASPDIVAVTASETGAAGSAGVSPPVPGSWPAVDGPDDRVPLAIVAAGVSPESDVPPGTTLDAVAPTIASLIGLDRPHPEIRSGVALGRTSPNIATRLVLIVAVTGIGSADLAGGAWPYLDGLMDQGAATSDAAVGSLPMDAAATLTTIGTGAMPRQHGVTGAYLRDRGGRLVRAWSPTAAGSVVATLADDLDMGYRHASLIGLVAADRTQRGLIGDGWYPGHDRDEVTYEATGAARVRTAQEMLRRGFGADHTPDLLGVVLDGTDPAADTQLRHVVEAARRAAGTDLVVAVSGTGPVDAPGPAVSAATVVGDTEATTGVDASLVEAAIPGGVFLDRAAMAETGTTGRVVQGSMLELRTDAGARLFADAFQGYAVSFGRYC